MKTPSIKILLVDDHQIILDSLSLLFSSVQDVEIAGKLNDSREVITFLSNHDVDILVSDLHMPNLNGIDLTLKIRELFPKVKILLLTMEENAISIRDAIQAGINGYILKKSGKEELERAIKTILAGKKYFSEEVIEELTNLNTTDLNDTFIDTIIHLTSREIEIIKLIALELSTNEMADKLFISATTVETHRANIMKKLGVKTSIGVTKYAIKHKLIDY